MQNFWNTKNYSILLLQEVCEFKNVVLQTFYENVTQPPLVDGIKLLSLSIEKGQNSSETTAPSQPYYTNL